MRTASDPKCSCGCMAETTAHMMLRCPYLNDATTARHNTVLGQVREAFQMLDNTFEQQWCATVGSLFPELMEEYPELCRCPILEVWKQPFDLASRQVLNAIFLGLEGHRAVVMELFRTDDLEP